MFYLQNLPSIICARVLDPKEGELILDMCAAPGGKTTHLASLVNNKSKIIAFDKISSKVNRMKDMCAKMNATCVECFCQDATKLGEYTFLMVVFRTMLKKEKKTFY